MTPLLKFSEQTEAHLRRAYAEINAAREATHSAFQALLRAAESCYPRVTPPHPAFNALGQAQGSLRQAEQALACWELETEADPQFE